jgi:lipoprotein-releasing system permease protein
VLKIFLSLRYLQKKKIILLCITAVALTVALLIVVDSLFSGLIYGINRSFREESGDMVLYTYGKPIPQYGNLVKKLEELAEVRAAAPYTVDGGLLWLETGDVREAYLKGVDPETSEKFFDWKKRLLRQKNKEGPPDFNVPGFPESAGAWVGVNIAAEPNGKTGQYDLGQLGQLIGRQVILTTKSADQKRKTVSLRISDIVFSDTYFGDQMVYLPFQLLYGIQTGLDRPGYTDFIGIKLSDAANPDAAQQAIAAVWLKFASEQLGWSDADISQVRLSMRSDSQYLYELKKQLGILLLIFGVICSVAILLVFCIFYMIVETKLKDIAIIKSCGAGSSAVALVFTAFGGCVGITGSAIGIIIGFVITKNINAIEDWIRIVSGIKLWLQSSYILNYIPNTVNWPDVLPIVLAAVAGCCLGAIIPALVAAGTKPVEILRYE